MRCPDHTEFGCILEGIVLVNQEAPNGDLAIETATWESGMVERSRIVWSTEEKTNVKTVFKYLEVCHRKGEYTCYYKKEHQKFIVQTMFNKGSYGISKRLDDPALMKVPCIEWDLGITKAGSSNTKI